ncbi:MAG: ATP-binding protein [Halioglobus sp.]
MRGSIFIKIFLGFWLVSIAILGSWLISNSYIESLPAPERQHRPPHGPPERFVLGLIYGLQNASPEQLPAIIEEAKTKHEVNVWLLDRQGADQLQQNVPASVAAVADQLRGRKRQAFARGQDGPLLAHRVHLSDGSGRRMVLMFPKPNHRIIGFLIANNWLRLLLAILVSGLICYALSRVMTNRLRDLRQASRRLADGDLQARINVRERGGDETDELARDFNTMAGQLEHRMQAQKQLLSDVSHELRSPLARMRVALALAMEDRSQRQDLLKRMDSETVRLESLIAQLLSSQQQSLAMDKHIDLISLLKQLCDDANFEGKQLAKVVTLQTELSEAIIPSNGDLLHRSFENIIRNALRHTPPHTEVEVLVSTDATGFKVRIVDSGPGVTNEELQRIFDEFYRVDSARSRDEGGYGLGLSIAYRAIAQHGGKLYAKNTDKGLAVTAWLPK